MIREAALVYGWKINLSTIASLWSEGCIIKSDLMRSLIDIFKSNQTLLEYAPFIQKINAGLESWELTLESSLKQHIPTSSMSSAWHYFLAISQKQSSANLIQAQRDYFGAHGFKRTDSSDDTLHHGPWNTYKN